MLADVHSAEVQLIPWTAYFFHVKARNNLGYSDASEIASCTSLSNIPYTNPKGVCSRSEGADELIITWKVRRRN